MYSLKKKVNFALITPTGKLGPSSFVPLDVNFEGPLMDLMPLLSETFKLKKEDYYLRRLQVTNEGKFVAEDKLHIHLSAKAQALKENGHIVIYPLSFHDDDQLESLARKVMDGWMTKSSIKETKKTSTKRRWFVLSSDHLGLLYYFQDDSPKGKPKGIIDLQFCEVNGEHNEMRIRKKVSFAGDSVEYIVLPDTLKETKDWMTHLRKLTTPGVKTSMFGCYLTSLELRGLCRDGIPIVVIQLVEELERRGLDVEGIFRVPGSATDIEQLQRLFDSGVNPQLAGYDVHTIAGLFKQYLRELPEPLFTYKRYSEFISYVKDPHAVVKLMSQLPTINQGLIHFLLNFLRKVVEHSRTNLMEERSLATVFAPNILRPREETHSTLCDSDLVASLLCSLMKLSDYDLQHASTSRDPDRTLSTDYGYGRPPSLAIPSYTSPLPSYQNPSPAPNYPNHPPPASSQRPVPIPKSPSMPSISQYNRPQPPAPVGTVRSQQLSQPVVAPQTGTFRGSAADPGQSPDIVIAKYDYTSQGQRNAKGEAAMSMKKGDIIYVLEKREHWMLGVLNGEFGLIPSNYVVAHTRSAEEEVEDLRPKYIEALKRLHEYECAYGK